LDRLPQCNVTKAQTIRLELLSNYYQTYYQILGISDNNVVTLNG